MQPAPLKRSTPTQPPPSWRGRGKLNDEARLVHACLPLPWWERAGVRGRLKTHRSSVAICLSREGRRRPAFLSFGRRQVCHVARLSIEQLRRARNRREPHQALSSAAQQLICDAYRSTQQKPPPQPPLIVNASGVGGLGRIGYLPEKYELGSFTLTHQGEGETRW